MNIKALAAGVAALALAAGSASASLLTNGSFETGNFSGWTQFGNTGFTGVTGAFDGVAPTDGSFQAFFGPVGSTGGIRQDVATVSGQHYTVSFDLFNFGGTPSFFDISFGGVSLFQQTNAGSQPYTTRSFDVVATGALSTLSITTQQNPDYWLVDNVTVDRATGAVPEPATWAIMLTGFLGAGAMIRRRKAALA